jgi:hypothetical protein
MPILPDKLNPVICMKRDFAALKFCLDKISICEPCSVVGICGSGEKIIYEELLKEYKKLKNNSQLLAINAQNEEYLKDFLKKIEKISDPLICVILLSTSVDVSWFIKKLDEIRDINGTKFTSVVFSPLGEVLEAYNKKQKILFRSLYKLQPIEENDTRILINDFQRRFSFKPTEKQITNIIQLGGGNCGLIKSLYLFLRENPDLLLENKYNEPSISSRLEGMINNLPKGLVEDLYYYPVDFLNEMEYRDILESFGFVIEGKIASPLLKMYISEKYKFTRISETLKSSKELLINSLTVSEQNVYTLLESKFNQLVKREEVGDVLWKNNPDKYSNWAIDQVISRLRKKMEMSKTPQTLVSKKGIGFMLQMLV